MSNLLIKKNISSSLLILFWLLMLLIAKPSAAQKQTKKDLENKKKQLQNEIEYTNQLLAETKKNKKISLNQLVTLNKKITVREELIYTINSEIKILNKQINQNNETIKGLQNEYVKLKNEYAKMIYYAYKNQDAYSRLMFVFASKDFEQAFMRLKYMQQYNDYRHKQAEIIIKSKRNLDEKVQGLETQKSSQRVLLSSEQAEKSNLNSEKTEKEQVFSKLQVQEGKLKKDLEKKVFKAHDPFFLFWYQGNLDCGRLVW